MATSTVRGYEKILNHLFLPALGGTRIDQITYAQLIQLVNGYPWGSKKTRNNALTPLRGIFDLAIVDGHIHQNPAIRLRALKVQQKPPDPFTRDEMEAILKWFSKHRDPQTLNYFEFAFFSGLRTSELIAVQWGDVDFSGGFIRVQRSKVLKEEKEESKTYLVRDVEMGSRAKAALERQRRHSQLRGREVFMDPITGEPYINDKPPWLQLVACMKALGIRHRRAYNTRHTYATLCLMAGSNPFWVSRQLGHANLKTTLEKYAKWIDGADSGTELSKLDDYMKGEHG